MYALWLPLAGMALAAGWSRRRRAILSAVLLAVFATLMLLQACGGGSHPSGNGMPGTPPGTYTVTVNGVLGNVTRSTTITLTVQ